MDSPLLIGVIGASAADPELETAAAAVGAEIARRGWWLVCGGLGGVMAAACRGARAAGGHTIGVLPGADATAANPWVEVPIVTGLGEARNVLITRTSRACIAVGGGYGTLSEVAFCLKFGRPVVALETGAGTTLSVAGLARAASPADACAWVESQLSRGG